MSTKVSRAELEAYYEEEARDYLRLLPLEHFMEATPQATQREITLASLALVKARRPDVQVFNELLVQYPRPGHRKHGKVVPDNMVVVWDREIKAKGSYAVEMQPTRPFWVLEYVSKESRRKDYEENFDKYETELKVPYYLLFYPEIQDLSLYRHNGQKYVSVPANERGRHALPELDLEMAILDGWVRFWFRGELLPLPADLLRELDKTREQLAKSERKVEQERQRAEAAERELESLRAQLRQLQAPPSA